MPEGDIDLTADFAPNPMATGAGSAPEPLSADALRSRVLAMQTELDLSEEVVRDLLTISGANIVVIADDSSSMSQVSSTTDIYKPKTRWMEMRETLSKLIYMLLVIGSSGFMVKFLNDTNLGEDHFLIFSAEVLFHDLNGNPRIISHIAS